MQFENLGRMRYRPAWDYQVQVHESVMNGGEERVLFVEHDPVITFGRRPGVARNLVASEEQLAKLGVEVVESDRGGDITYHGPGQVVVYPIIRLVDHKLSISGYVHRLEAIVVDALRQVGITDAAPDPEAPGVWVPTDGKLAKICAVGVRIRRGVSMHGIALNVATDLRYFELIVPCGLVGRPVTSLQKLLGEKAPTFAEMRDLLKTAFERGM